MVWCGVVVWSGLVWGGFVCNETCWGGWGGEDLFMGKSTHPHALSPCTNPLPTLTHRLPHQRDTIQRSVRQWAASEHSCKLASQVRKQVTDSRQTPQEPSLGSWNFNCTTHRILLRREELILGVVRLPSPVFPFPNYPSTTTPPPPKFLILYVLEFNCWAINSLLTKLTI